MLGLGGFSTAIPCKTVISPVRLYSLGFEAGFGFRDFGSGFRVSELPIVSIVVRFLLTSF